MNFDGKTLTEENSGTRRKPRHSVTLSTINPTYTRPAQRPRHRGHGPATNRLSYRENLKLHINAERRNISQSEF